MLFQYLANAVVSGAVFALVAVGFGLIYNSTRVFHFAHAGVYTASAYVLYFCLVSIRLNSFLGFLLAVCFSALLGAALERYVYSPLVERGASLGVILISSLGVNTVIVNVIAAIFGNEGKILLPGAGETVRMGAVFLTRIQILQFIVSVVICSSLTCVLRFSRFGHLIRALVDSPTLLGVIGVDVKRMRLKIFAIGSLLAGIAACLVAFDIGMDPYGGLNMLLTAAVAVIIGGLKTIEGAIVGAFGVALIQNLAVYQISARWEQPVTFLVLILFLLFRPLGLLGRRGRVDAT